MNKVIITDHPLIQHKLTLMRMEETGSKDFRELLTEITMLMGYEVTKDLPLGEIEIKTPVQKLAIVPILRAGIGMVDGFVNLIPAAKVGHIGLYRDPVTCEPVEYYCKLPEDIGDREIFLVDPMLATGGSATAAIQLLKEKGANNIRMINLVAAPEGIEAVHAAYPEVDIYVAAVDEKLDDHKYIVPGLGDAGDRLFGTK